MNDVPRTFRELFEHAHFRGVEIPIIQRDYAQGRPSAEDVLTQFVRDLYKALSLPPESDELPLDLDFIYGSLDEREGGAIFCPLDGQQRLTTLFLLHWYLACRDDKSEVFRSFICSDQQSRFSYKVRPSSEEFCDALVNATFDMSALPVDDGDSADALSRAIMDKPWFFLMWRQDPTILSALCVLNAIHTRFKQTTGLYDRLVDDETPAITFQFLNLHDFGLSDELYIKMNARGKPLTPFEAFKAKLEQKVNELLPGEIFEPERPNVSARDYFSHRIDVAWADLFWAHRDPNTNTFDRQFMNFVRGLAFVTYPHSNPEVTPEIAKVMERLGAYDVEYSFYRYDTDGCITAEFIRSLVAMLDGLSGTNGEMTTYLSDGGYYDEHDVFARILNRERPRRTRDERRGVIQSEWVQFYGYCSYLIKHTPKPGDPAFYEWIRVVSNLATNTIYPHMEELRRALVGVEDMLSAVESDSLLDYVANGDNLIAGLNQQQIREERLKAQLIQRSDAWRTCLREAEKHGYFKGQIEFLLDFSGVLRRWLDAGNCAWSDEDDESYRQSFTSYYTKACAIFDDMGLRSFPDSLWERALLSLGDYLLPKGSNRSLLDDTDRDASWKRLLRGSEKQGDDTEDKRGMVRLLLDRVDPNDVEQSLTEIVDEFAGRNELDERQEWRRLLVQCPAAVVFCKQRFIRMTDEDCIYLLSKKRKSSHHAELHTFHLEKCVLPQMRQRGELAAFDSIEYCTVCYESSRPRIHLVSSVMGLDLRVMFFSGRFHVHAEGVDGEMAAPLATLLQSLAGFAAGEDGVLALSVAVAEIATKLAELSSLLTSRVQVGDANDS